MSDEQLARRGRPMRTPPRSRKQDAVTTRQGGCGQAQAIRDEWEEAATGTITCRRSMLRRISLREGCKAASTDEFSLWRHSTADAMGGQPGAARVWDSRASDRTQYMRQRARGYAGRTEKTQALRRQGMAIEWTLPADTAGPRWTRGEFNREAPEQASLFGPDSQHR